MILEKGMLKMKNWGLRWQWNSILLNFKYLQKKGENLSIQFYFGIGPIVHCQVSQGNLQLTGAQKYIHL